MRDYLVVAIVLMSTPVGLVRPFYGLLVYAWISYMNPHLLAWSFAQTFPVAKIAAMSVMGGVLLSPPKNFTGLRRRESIAMLCLWVTFTISTALALYPDVAWQVWQDVSKLVAMALLTILLLSDRQRIRYFLLVIALSLGFYGVKGGIFSLATSGQYLVYGPGDSIIGANNAIGLALNMALPLFWYLAQEERGWMKRALQVMFFLSIPAVMFTYSRASILTLGVVVATIVLKSRRRLVLVPTALMLVLLVLPLAPQNWWNRVDTIQTYEEDTSAMSRIDNWKMIWLIALERPLTGAGFQFFTVETVSQYAPEFLETYNGDVWDTHSIYFAMLGSHGFPGLIAFLVVIALTWFSCSNMKRGAGGRLEARWVGTYSDMIQVSLLGFLVNGAFVNMEYFDLPYQLIALTASMKVIFVRELSEEEQRAGRDSLFVMREPSVASNV